uniref:tRNA (guanine-N(1)-)-methyltransferase n=1 Tax=uncultured bacterium contig00056 TaxID=1181540 RepID=A0A806JYX1_9BACT|nr:tRNA (Guanine37-N1)-methyltransferase [uncultured bacterium contig00056]
MKYTVLTLFPEITDAFFATSIMAKAIKRGIIEYKAVNIRDFALDKHKTCDDAPYGGGPGMLMLPEPLDLALKSVLKKSSRRGAETQGTQGEEKGRREEVRGQRVIYLSPSGKPFSQEFAKELAAEKELILVCGRYEGIDQRIIDRYVDDEISIGDYVLSSGEVAALAIIDATYRLVDDVIRAESLSEESFSDGLLEYPQFTRPEEFDTMRVPEVLLSGHHEQIRLWRLEKRVEKTLKQRPDLIKRGRELGVFNSEINGIIDKFLGEKDERN